MEKYKIQAQDISKVDIYSFGNAGTLYRDAPKNENEGSV